jgi:hypothetical protein
MTLSPGERAVNWVKALAIVVGILTTLLGYTNKERIAGWIGGPVEADGKTEIVEGGMTFEESVVKNSKEVRTELDQIKEDIKQLKAKSSNRDGSLQRQITKWHGTE